MKDDYTEIKPDDQDNYRTVYLKDHGDGMVAVYDGSFNEPDVYRSIFMEAGQLRRLAAALGPPHRPVMRSG